MDKKLLEILVCPICKGPLIYQKSAAVAPGVPGLSPGQALPPATLSHPWLAELICKWDKLAYPVRDDIPVMLEGEARKLGSEELDAL